MVEIGDLRQVRRNLDRFLEAFDVCIKTAPSRRHLRTYVGGQVGDLARKSVEPIALEAGIAPRTLQEFLSIHRWDEEGVRHRIQELVKRDHADENAIAVIDETGFPKKGTKTAGVQRQYCGATGKNDNCVVTVHLGYACGGFHTLIDGDLYLPEGTWHKNRKRCQEAGIPDEVVYRPKWRIALDQVEAAIRNGVHFPYVTADETYGRSSQFRNGIADLKRIYVVETPCSLYGWTKRPDVIDPAAALSVRGRPLEKPRLSKTAQGPRRVDQLWRRGGPSWQSFHVKNTRKGPVVWEVRRTRFFPSENDLPGEMCGLMIARNVLTSEVKYFLSNAASDTPSQVLLHVAFSRWHIERIFQDGKGQIGMGHFEVRSYRPLVRHLILSMVSLMFLARETQKLRKKPWMELTPGTPCCRETA
jgi:SRSO17 transposase